MLVRILAAITSVVFLYGCAATGDRMAASGTGLVGAWEISTARAAGVGKSLVTISSDGTLFRSGDTHTTFSGAHGAWKAVGPNLYQGSYVGLLFDQGGKFVGYARNNFQVSLIGDNELKGDVRVSTRDLQDRETAKSSVAISGRRIQVQPY
jgi:hypothetical protein